MTTTVSSGKAIFLGISILIAVDQRHKVVAQAVVFGLFR
jgi:hypothetical protein